MSQRTWVLGPVLMSILAVLTFGEVTGAGTDMDRLFVLISPNTSAGPSAIVTFDVDSRGLVTQGPTTETGGLGRVHTSPQDVVVDPVGRLLFATNNESADLSVFSIGEGGLLVPVPGSPFPIGGRPTHLALHPELRVLYLSNSEKETVGAYAIAGDGSLNEIETVPVGSPRGLAVEPGGQYLYVADQFLEEGVHGFEISPVGTLTELPGSPFLFDSNRPQLIRISSDGALLFALDLDNGIAVFHIGDDGELELVPGSPFSVGGFSGAFELTEDDAYIYTGFRISGHMRGHAVEPDGSLTELPFSPFNSLFGIRVLLDSEGTSVLYQVSRDTRSILPSAITPDGDLEELSDDVVIEDAEVRRPNGAAYFRPRPDVPASGIRTSIVLAAILLVAAALLRIRH